MQAGNIALIAPFWLNPQNWIVTLLRVGAILLMC